MKEQVRDFEREDGSVRVVIYAHNPVPPNLFSFNEEIWKEYKNDSTGQPSAYWLPSYQSGLFDSAEAAEAEARSMFPWIVDQISN